jgi:hypothetical protein
MAVFAALIVVLEVLGDMSNRNAGLANGDAARKTMYAWTYLPGLGLTLLAGMWTRVDHQAKAAAPWVRMAKGPAPAEKTLLLDYVDMPLPVSIVRAVLNRDVVVACTAMVSLHLGVLVVLWTALLTLSLVNVPDLSSRIRLDTAFVDDASGLARVGSVPFFGMVGLLQGNVSLPDDVSPRYAYQRFSADVPFGTELRATVDGFSASLECESAQLSLLDAQYRTTDILLNTTVSTPGCSIDMPISSQAFASNATVLFSRFGQGRCGGSSAPEEQRVVIIFGSETINSTSLALAQNSTSGIAQLNVTISQSTQLVCKPNYAISRLDIKRNDWSLTNLDLADTNTKTLSKVQPWAVAQAFFDSFQGALAGNFSDTNPPFYQTGNLTVDPIMYLALSLRRATAGSPVAFAALFDRTTLQSVAEDYFQQHTALMAASALVEEASITSTGTVMLRGERLLVRSFVVQVMVTLLGVSFILTAVAMCFVPKRGFLPRDPGTIIDTATLLAHSRSLLQLLRGAGGGSEKVLRERLRGNKFSIGIEAYEHGSSSDPGYFKIFGGSTASQVRHGYVEETDKYAYPANLHPAVRVASLLGMLAIITVLELSLRTSERLYGFQDVTNETYSHFLWTAMPALILAHFATYFASVDFTTRALVPYTALKDGSAFQRSVSLNYLDKTVPHSIYEAVCHRNLRVVSGGLTVLVSSLLVVFAAPLFFEVTIPGSAVVQLLSQDYLFLSGSAPDSGVCLSCRNGTVVSSMVLNDNLSYPAFTYENLVFPTLKLDPENGPSRITDDFTITASIPAIRPRLECMIAKQSARPATRSPGSFTFTDETNRTLTINTSRLPQGAMASVQDLESNPFFGVSSHSIIDQGNGTTVSHWVFIWGQMMDIDTNHTTNPAISGLFCNESIEQVTTETTFHGPSLRILPSSPPLVDDTTAVHLAFNISDNWDYSDLASIPMPHILDPFFSTLVSSRYSIPLVTLGNSDSATVDSVAEAIKFHHGIVRTQVLNLSARQPLLSDVSLALPSASSPDLDTPTPLTFTGTATTTFVPSLPQPFHVFRRADAPVLPTDPSTSSSTQQTLVASRRVIQSPTSSRVLQATLSLTILLSLLSLLLSARPNHPRPGAPSSIASVSALLADGNIFGLLGRGAEWSATDQLKGAFMDGLHVAMGFRMGWGGNTSRRRRERDEAVAGNVFGVSAIRTGGWGGGEGVGLGGLARVGLGQRRFVRDWGWRT